MKPRSDVVAHNARQYRFFGLWLRRYHAYCNDETDRPGGLELERLCALFAAGVSPARVYALRLTLAVRKREFQC